VGRQQKPIGQSRPPQETKMKNELTTAQAISKMYEIFVSVQTKVNELYPTLDAKGKDDMVHAIMRQGFQY
jgi:hypothetical protein